MRQITSIQSLRALAALMVVVGHAQSEAAVAAMKRSDHFASFPLLPWGAGVDLFFVISGFIMVVASERLFAAPGGAASFISRRLKRIVPLYWLFTALYALIQVATHKRVDGGDLIASFLFWPQDVYGDGVLRPIYSLGWTLNYEMFFYALFASAIMLPRRAAVAMVAVVLALGVTAGQILALPPGPLAFWTQPIVLEFALGMGLGLAWRDELRLSAPMRLTLAATALAILVIDPMRSAHQALDWITPNDFARLASWGLPAAALVAAAVLGRAPAAPRALAGSAALGDASYALYLAHPFVLGLLLRAWAATGLAGALGYWPFVAGGIALSIAAAFVVHRSFELPVARALALRRVEGKPIMGVAKPPATP